MNYPDRLYIHLVYQYAGDQMTYHKVFHATAIGLRQAEKAIGGGVIRNSWVSANDDPTEADPRLHQFATEVR